jgi:hypothetical protein
MNLAFLSTNLDLIDLTRGLALSIVSGCCARLRGREIGRVPWGWFSLFGVSAGLHAWLETLTFGVGDSPFFAGARTLVPALSFVFLLRIGQTGMRSPTGRTLGPWIMALLLVCAAAGAPAGIDGAGLERVFSTDTALVEGPIADSWGVWLSDLVRLSESPGGAMVAVLGLDQDANAFQQAVAAERFKGILASLPVLTAIVAGRALHRRAVAKLRSNDLDERPDLVLRSGVPALAMFAGTGLFVPAFINARRQAHDSFDSAFRHPALPPFPCLLGDGDWAEVRMSDTGAGIPERVLDSIFTPFFTTTPVGKGTGQRPASLGRPNPQRLAA